MSTPVRESTLHFLLKLNLLFFLHKDVASTFFPMRTKLLLCIGENKDVLLKTLEGWVYIVPIHGPLDGPLYMGSHIHQQL